MSVVIVTAQNKGRRRGGGKEDRKKRKKSQVPPSPLFEYEPALTAKVKKKSLHIVSAQKGSCFDLPPASAIIFGA